MKKPITRILLCVALLLIGWGFYKALSLRAFYLALVAEIGPPSIPSLIDALDEPGLVRGIAVSSLAKFGVDSIHPLIRALEDKDARRREGAAMCLGRIVTQGKAMPVIMEARPALRKSLEDEDCGVRIQAARALWFMDRKPDEVVPVLVAAWKTVDGPTRHLAADTLAEMGPVARQSVPVLIESLKEEDQYVRAWAAEALKAIDPEAARAAGATNVGLRP
jgi:HEAT repeat protein